MRLGEAKEALGAFLNETASQLANEREMLNSCLSEKARFAGWISDSVALRCSVRSLGKVIKP